MGGTKCLRLGTCELEYMGGVLQRNSSMTETDPGTRFRPSYSYPQSTKAQHS